MTNDKLAALVYSDIFNYPLTSQELTLWSIAGFKKFNFENNFIKKGGGFYFGLGKEHLVAQREKRNISSLRKVELAQAVADILSTINSIEAIFLTGSVAAMNAKEESDIDLMIITSENHLWLTRFQVISQLRFLNIYRNTKDMIDRICPNIFLDIDHLKIETKNIFTAHEILQAKCLFDRGGIENMWLEENEWAQDFLPKAYKNKKEKLKVINRARPDTFFIFYFLNFTFFIAQYFYMFPKITKERVGWGYAFFHPRDLSMEILVSFRQRLLELVK